MLTRGGRTAVRTDGAPCRRVVQTSGGGAVPRRGVGGGRYSGGRGNVRHPAPTIKITRIICCLSFPALRRAPSSQRPSSHCHAWKEGAGRRAGDGRGQEFGG